MPIYEYQCQSCNQIHEIIQRISEDPLTTCPACQGPLKKMISMSAFHLKGGGWYADGYADSGNCGKSASCNGGKPNSSNGGKGGAAKTDAPSTSASSSATSEKTPCAKGGDCCAART